MFNPIVRHPAARPIVAGVLLVLLVTLVGNASAVSTAESSSASLRWDNRLFTSGPALVSHLSAKGVDADAFLRAHPSAADELGLTSVKWDGKAFFTMAGLRGWSRHTGASLALWLQRHPRAATILSRNAEPGRQPLAIRRCAPPKCAAPRPAAPPVASGPATAGKAVTVTSGAWSGTKPFIYAYRWQRCSSATSCSDIDGATGQTYTVQGADAGTSLRALVRVGNRLGDASAASNALGPVTAPAPTGSGSSNPPNPAPTTTGGSTTTTPAPPTPAPPAPAPPTPAPPTPAPPTPAPPTPAPPTPAPPTPAPPAPAPPTPAPTATGRFGIATGGTIEWANDADLARELDGLTQIGADWIRFDVKWSSVEPNRGTYSWALYDRLVEKARARGLSIIANLAYSPSWARPTGATDNKWAPANASDYAAFARAAVAHLAPLGVMTYEIWNEPNHPEFWKPRPDAVAYTALLRAAYPAIKAANPSATVLAGAFSPAGGYNDPMCGGSGTTTKINPVNFLQTMYANGARGYFDGLSHHPYTGSDGPGGTHRCNAWYQMFGTTPSLRSLLVSNGDGAKKIWATEFGTDLAWVDGSEARQAAQIAEAMRIWRGYDWAAGFMVYSYKQDLEGFNLVRSDWAPRPVWYSFQAVARE